MELVTRDDAETWATWFRALGDPTRIVLLNLLARAERPLSVAEIVEAMDVGQSTVSHHLRILGEVRFVLVERQGTSSMWRINDRCLSCFPSAAELVMGRVPTDRPWDPPPARARRSAGAVR
jgi:DNA-binding transcriptional ArsR family regulator